jgi:hypothetical protein
MRSFLARLVLGNQGSINELWSFAPDENAGAFYQPQLSRPIGEASIAEQAEARPRVQAQIAERIEGFQFLKTHSMYARHAGSPTINAAVTAGAIYVVRNPLDIAVSYSEFRKRSIDDAIGILNEPGRLMPRNYKHAYVFCGSWSEHVTSWTRNPHERLLVLRYEDLLANPVEYFGQVVEFLRIKVDEATLGAAIEATSFERLQSEEQKEGFRERPEETDRFFRRGIANQWREQLTPAQIAAVVRPNKAAMTAMGYWEPEFDQL